MKGFFCLAPLEWHVDLKGESWYQGDRVTGTLTLTNQSATPHSVASGGVRLVLADIKKIHARDLKQIQVLAESICETQTLPSKGSSQLAFDFALPVNCTISDKKASLYLLWGPTLSESNLQLNILPQKIFTDVTALLETFLRFKPKDIKAAKNAVEFKLIPPTSREFAHIEALHLEQRLEGDELQLQFTFKVKTLDMASITTKVAKEQKTLAKSLKAREYSLGRGILNQDGILKALDEVLKQVKMTGL